MRYPHILITRIEKIVALVDLMTGLMPQNFFLLVLKYDQPGQYGSHFVLCNAPIPLFGDVVNSDFDIQLQYIFA